MDGVFQAMAVCLMCCILSLTIKGTSPSLSFGLSLGVCAAVLLLLGTKAGEAIAFAENVLSSAGLDAALFLPLCKVVGIAVLSHLCAQLCRDAGESAIASAVELSGTVCCIAVSVPLWEALWEVISSLL